MSDAVRRHQAPVPRLPLRRALGRVIAISLVAAVIAFGALSIQMALGSDPALGPKSAATVASESDSTDDSQDDSTPGPLTSLPAPAPAPTTVQTTTS